ncbi:hypothetical protein HMPREF3039_00798 [Akkermansia sp. KLE1798]|nr:hypothetical protein HMPREF3039_00798 [Akkermansia sp. KLE1798]KZA04295.1 hypothetical protein HMPREF1326_01963 [Akkermansia sp. KLE1605]
MWASRNSGREAGECGFLRLAGISRRDEKRRTPLCGESAWLKEE